MPKNKLEEVILNAFRQVQPEAAKSLLGVPAEATGNRRKSAEGSGLAKVLGSVFSSGLGIKAAISGLRGLFGGDEEEAAPLARYAPPPALRIEAANPSIAGEGIRYTDYSQDGRPRELATAPQITIQVNAIDSRSFSDHSHEIAQAVREAMLNMHGINDVIGDL